MWIYTYEYKIKIRKNIATIYYYLPDAEYGCVSSQDGVICKFKFKSFMSARNDKDIILFKLKNNTYILVDSQIIRFKAYDDIVDIINQEDQSEYSTLRLIDKSGNYYNIIGRYVTQTNAMLDVSLHFLHKGRIKDATDLRFLNIPEYISRHCSGFDVIDEYQIVWESNDDYPQLTFNALDGLKRYINEIQLKYRIKPFQILEIYDGSE